MFELDSSNAALYLSERRGLEPDTVRVTALGGGVSNTVLLVEYGGSRFVLKQALAKLRVEQDWFSDRRRVFRESAAIQALGPQLPPGSVPAVLFEDPENCLFAMTAAPEGAQTWKALLLAGNVQPEVAERVARIEAAILRHSWNNRACEEQFGDQAVFDQLRLDPYYRATADRHPDLKPRFEGLIETCRLRRCALVHGDWSPKNFLLHGETVMAIDFEVIHYGDAAFDSAFLLNHLLLKSFHRPRSAGLYAEAAERYWRTLEACLPADAGWFEQGTVGHLGGLLLARIDGKSPAEYIRQEAVKDKIRKFARELLASPPATVRGVFEAAL